ncbi:hypothetical protein MKFW12EY_11730 [Methylomonas koyamae]|nr:hypothetical protein MKFW12EY_11730 [Methylomonas koyamae]
MPIHEMSCRVEFSARYTINFLITRYRLMEKDAGKAIRVEQVKNETFFSGLSEQRLEY